MDHKTGSLTHGKDADIVLINTNSLHMISTTALVIIGDVGARPAVEGIAEALRGSVVEDSSATLDEVA